MDEYDRLRNAITLNDREIRRLRLQMDQIAAGGQVRGTSIGGVIPAANRPVAWWFNANLLGLGDELELLEGEGVWISGSFVDGRAYYHIGAYPSEVTGIDTIGGCYQYSSSPTTVFGKSGDWHESTPFDGSVRGNPTSISVLYTTGTAGEFSLMRGQVVHNLTKGQRVYIEDVNYALNELTVEANSPHDSDTWDEDDLLTTASQTNLGGWRGNTFVDMDVTPHIIPGTVPLGVILVGYTARRNADTWHLMFHPYEAFDVDKEINVTKQWPDDTLYYQVIVPVVVADARYYFTMNLWGLLADNASTLSRWSGQFTRGAYTGDGAGISGVDFAANDGWFGFGRALDLLEGAGIWVSGSMDGDEAEYRIGAYPPDLGPYISGVDFLADDAWFCFGRALELVDGEGIWISGTCADDVASYKVGRYALYSVADYLFTPDAAPGIDIVTGDQQGLLHHSGDYAESVVGWFIDAETAPTGTSLIIQLEYGDTDDLDTIGAWTEIDQDALPAGSKSIKFAAGVCTNSTIPANRLIRMNVDQVGSVVAAADAQVMLRVKRPLVS